MVAFDFSAYLAKLDPLTDYKIETLTGGLINLTVRAIRVGHRGADSDTIPERDHGPFHGHDSLILKYAPPFVAAVGDTAPLSPFRQVKE